MTQRKLQISRVGPITNADVDFGDLTVLVGPQATGKSIFLQFFKLLEDTRAVFAQLKKYGFDWNKETASFLDIYLGEGMGRIWRDGRSRMVYRGKAVELQELVARGSGSREESVFYIPAQRVLTLARGWPRPFTDYDAGDPFAVRDFSEKIRQMMQSGLGSGQSVFPHSGRLKLQVRDSLNATVFLDFQLLVDKQGAQKRLVLHTSQKGDPLPFMVWSAGQREFVPLLLGFYWLVPSGAISRRGGIKWVVIEEPEMGLHPRAISTVLLLVLELLSRDYRVCLSTHSPHVLDVVWALRVFQEHRAEPESLLDLFQVERRHDLKKMAAKVLQKRARVFYFDPRSGKTRDISNLDPGARDSAEAGWGGLAEFSGHVADVVADVVSASGT